MRPAAIEAQPVTELIPHFHEERIHPCDSQNCRDRGRTERHRAHWSIGLSCGCKTFWCNERMDRYTRRSVEYDLVSGYDPGIWCSMCGKGKGPEPGVFVEWMVRL